MTKADVENHARTYSSSYKYDVKENKKSSKWSTDFKAMALKTVIKLLLSKWGILSVEMQRAIQEDQKVYDEECNDTYADNMPEVVIAEDPFGQTVTEPEEIDITE